VDPVENQLGPRPARPAARRATRPGRSVSRQRTVARPPICASRSRPVRPSRPPVPTRSGTAGTRPASILLNAIRPRISVQENSPYAGTASSPPPSTARIRRQCAGTRRPPRVTEPLSWPCRTAVRAGSSGASVRTPRSRPRPSPRSPSPAHRTSSRPSRLYGNSPRWSPSARRSRQNPTPTMRWASSAASPPQVKRDPRQPPVRSPTRSARPTPRTTWWCRSACSHGSSCRRPFFIAAAAGCGPTPVEVQPDDVGQLLLERRVVGQPNPCIMCGFRPRACQIRCTAAALTRTACPSSGNSNAPDHSASSATWPARSLRPPR